MADALQLVAAAPSGPKDTGSVGDAYVDLTEKWLYLCVETNTWLRMKIDLRDW